MGRSARRQFSTYKYRRILLKLGGESFGDSAGTGLSSHSIQKVAEEIANVCRRGVPVAVVVGGGNLVRARQTPWLDRVVADRMGMLATVINGLALSEGLLRKKVCAVMQSAVPMAYAEAVDPLKARSLLSKGAVVIFAGGTGNPFVTTDTAAAIRAAEVQAEVLLKATNVDGVYTHDPRQNRRARLLKRVTYDEAIRQQLAVMDLTALTLCRENKIPIVVFNGFTPGNLEKVLAGRPVGTYVGPG